MGKGDVMPRSGSGRGSLLPLANRLSRTGGVTAVLVGLALCAIVQQAVIGPPGRRPAAERGRHAVKSPPTPKRTTRSPRPAPVTPLERQVRTVVLRQRAALARRVFGARPAAPDVSASRVDRAAGWASGTAAIPPPAGVTAMPDASLFLARRVGRRWTVALAGTKDFVRLLRAAPASVVSRAERPLLARFGTVAAAPRGTATRLALPWDAGQSWTMRRAGDHALRFNGGDGKVLAPGTGRLYRLCPRAPDRGMLVLIHPDGVASEYYGITDLAHVKDGAAVRQGGYLGRIGTDRPCGGGPPAAQATVSFALCAANHPVPLDGVRIGGWTLHTTAGRVSARRAGLRIEEGNPLLNLGVGAATPTPVPNGAGPPHPLPAASPSGPDDHGPAPGGTL